RRCSAAATWCAAPTWSCAPCSTAAKQPNRSSSSWALPRCVRLRSLSGTRPIPRFHPCRTASTPMPTPARTPLRHKLVARATKAPVALVGDTSALLQRSGPLRFGQGVIATVLALSLGFLSLLGVLAFHFPQYLTTPELRHQYSVDVLRQALFVALLIAGG